MKIVVLMLAVTLPCVGCDRTSQSFSDYEELKRRDALQSGWFPEWLPTSSYNIEEAHDMDTNQSMLSAKYKQNSFAVPPPCEPVDTVPAAPFKKSWWPAPGTLSIASGWHLYSCQHGEYAAIHKKKQLLLHWRHDGS
jgi:hypothetical protein